MKLEHINIRGLKSLRKFEHDFRDELGLVRDMTVFAGPNGSGKTTLMDAIAFPLSKLMGLSLPEGRSEIRLDTLVSAGEKECKIQYEVSVDEEEYEEIFKMYRKMSRSGYSIDTPFFGKFSTKLTWQYPPPPGTEDGWSAPSRDHLNIVKGYEQARKLWLQHSITADVFKRVGSLFYFDQERSISTKSVITVQRQPADVLIDPLTSKNKAGKTRFNLKEHLVNLGIMAKLDPKSLAAERFGDIKATFDRLLSPRRLIGTQPRAHSTEYDVLFEDDRHQYYFDGLSSGEKQILLMITEFIYRSIYKSIVLIDEVELHLHPPLQRDVVRALRKLGGDNQFILTTHSPAIEPAVPAGSLRNLAELDKTAPVAVGLE
jgi:predicted ATPase